MNARYISHFVALFGLVVIFSVSALAQKADPPPVLPALPSDVELSIENLQKNALKYPPGLIVTEVVKDGAADKVGIKVGDILLQMDGADLRFDSQIAPIRDKARFEGKQSVTISVSRNGQQLQVALLPAPSIGIGVRPPMSDGTLALYEAAQSMPTSAAIDVIAKYRSVAQMAEQNGDLRLAAFFLNRANQSTRSGTGDEINIVSAELRDCILSGDGLLAARMTGALGNTARSLNELGLAEQYHLKSLGLRNHFGPNSLDLVSSLNNLGVVENSLSRIDEAVNYYKRALSIQEKLSPDTLDLAMLCNNMGNVYSDRGALDLAESYYRRGLTIRERLAPESAGVAASLNNLGILQTHRNLLDDAERNLKRALAIEEKVTPGSPAISRTLSNLGNVQKARGHLDDSEYYYKRALTSIESIAPESPSAAAFLGNLANMAYLRGRLSEASANYNRALKIMDRIAPNSPEVTKTLTSLGNIAVDRGDLDDAERYYNRSLRILESHSPESLDVAVALNSLGNLESARGISEKARTLYERALAIQEKVAPRTLETATMINNLGRLAEADGRLDVAQICFKRSLAIREQIAPGSLEVAQALTNLGANSNELGAAEAAESYQTRALAIFEKLAPGSLSVAASLNDLGNVAASRQQLDVADNFYKRGLAIQVKVATDSLEVSQSMTNLGDIATERHRLSEAESYHQRALLIRVRLAPRSLEVARSLYNLAVIAQFRHELGRASNLLSRAWEICRAYGRNVAGDIGRAQFGKLYRFVPDRLIALQIDQREVETAAANLEQSRSQALIQDLAQRAIAEEMTSPELWGAYHKALLAHSIAFKDAERASASLVRAQERALLVSKQTVNPTDLNLSRKSLSDSERDCTVKRENEVAARSEVDSRWADVIRSAKVALPKPVNPTTARKQLPAGTVLLEYAAGEKEVILFEMTSARVNAYRLPTTRKNLEQDVLAMRRLVARDVDSRGPKFADPPSGMTVTDPRNQRHQVNILRRLYSELMPAKVQADVKLAKHVILSPDDFLWDVPFAALVANSLGPNIYLGQIKQLSYTQSLTVLLQSRQSATLTSNGTPPKTQFQTPSANVLVVGNPVYSEERRAALVTGQPVPPPVPKMKISSEQLPAARGEVGTLTADSEPPQQLPHAEEEAKEVAALYHTQAHVGVEPTEAWFRKHAPDARIIHLATHGYLNAYSAQSGGVLLAVPEMKPTDGEYDNDGALQAWEVWSMKLKAELVVLSACETGRGYKFASEGLVGLTRAWQYAGAKSIVSSQWKVSDGSTSVLMTAFHKHLIAGVDKDEALRLAMIETSKTGQWSNPYYWAAFVLVGETGKLTR